MSKKQEFWAVVNSDKKAIFCHPKGLFLLIFLTRKAAKKCLPSDFEKNDKCRIVKIKIPLEKKYVKKKCRQSSAKA